MYFIDEEHEQNWFYLYGYYTNAANSRQYQANLYLAAVPDLHRLLKPELIQKERGTPLAQLMDYDERKGELIPSHPGLTSGTILLLEVAMSLFNGHSCSLDAAPSADYAKAIVQAVKIRLGVE